MERPVTPKHSRPFFGRSYSATERLSPSQSRALPPLQQQVTKRKHLHALQTANERLHRHGHGERLGLIHSAIDHQSTHPFTELGRFTSKASSGNLQSSSNNSRHESPTRVTSSEPFVAEIPSESVGPQDVDRQKKRQEQSEEELRSTLNGLLELAHDNTRRLDQLQSAILEKVSTVRTTIRELQELSKSSSELHHGFGKTTTAFESETQHQIDAFADFDKQQVRVDGLVQRVHSGTEKAQALSKRLEAARGRVEAWEVEEKKWQARTTLRLKITWSCLLAFLSLIALLLVLRQVTRPSPALSKTSLPPLETATDYVHGPLATNDDIISNKSAYGLGSARKEELDPRLKLFDEL
ncbi:MAG: hypothetical protein M1828_006343 [Chrysothrix sp. TS-e1954]|nr:MAG: hypothetical protein M1828_006343 [Chrysothrix sp. TS-e1954]